MTSIFGIFNRLLPFATPGTLVLQDVLHLAAICTLLYFAPQIQKRLQTPWRATVLPGDDDGGQHLEHPQDDGEPGPGNVDDAAGYEIAEPDAGVHDDPNVAVPRNNLLQEANDHFEEGQAGPARAPVIPDQRNVGAKKAKALARRDQRRAYHEFQRSQGEAQRAKDAEGAEERERAQEAATERRKLAEAALEAKKARERDERRARDEAARTEEQRRREQAVELVRSRLESDKMCDLFKVAREVEVDDEEWVERILNSSGMICRRDDTLTMITGMGWAVRVSADDMQKVYGQLLQHSGESDNDGCIGSSAIGSMLEASLRQAHA